MRIEAGSRVAFAFGERFAVPSQEEVDAFIAASKTIPRSSGDEKGCMAWEQPAADRCLWRGAVEVEGAQVGGMLLFVNPAFGRAWCFKLLLHDEEVLRWDARPQRSGHNNPPCGCPDGFPRKVKGRDHEHVWVEGLDCRCACILGDDVDTSTHEHMFVSFCARTNANCEVAYTAPQPKLSLPI